METNRIINLRNEEELTQKQIADILGVTRSAYSLWELGKNIIPLNYLNKLANYYNVSIDYLTNLTNSKEIIYKHDSINIKKLGRKLKETRKKNNFSQENIASIFNTSHSVISAYESGKVLIQTIFIIKFAKITNTSIDWLLF